MSQTLREMIETRDSKKKKLQEKRDLLKAENRSANPDEVTEMRSLVDDIKKLNPEINAAEALEQLDGDIDSVLESRSSNPTGGGSGGNNDRNNPQGEQRSLHRGPENQNLDMFQDPDYLNRYSLAKTIQKRAQQLPMDGVELEFSQEIERRSGKSPTGFFVPGTLRLSNVEQRDLTTTTGSGALVNTTAPTMIDFLINRMLAFKLGVNVMNNLTGVIDLPKKTGKTTANWHDENEAATESEASIGQVTMQPSSVSAWTEYSRRLLNQVNIDVERFVRSDLMETIALAVDYALFCGSGQNDQPEGILTNSNVPLVAIGTNGGPISWQKLVEFETSVAANNADAANMHFVTTPGVYGDMKTIERAANTAKYILTDDGMANGYKAHRTGQIRKNYTKGSSDSICHGAVFGDFSQATIAFWSGIDIIVNPYSGDTARITRVSAMQDCDIAVRQDKAFARCLDLTANVN